MRVDSEKGRVAPGPRGVPLLGSVPDAWRDPLGLYVKAWREYGDVAKLKMGPFRYFIVNDPDAIHRVLVENHKNYTKSRNYKGLKLVLGQGLVTSEGDFWRRQRKLAQPAFHRERLAGFAELMVADTRAMLERWAAGPLGAGEAFDAHHEMMRLTLRIVGRTLFSTDLDGASQEIGDAITVVIRAANDFAESLFVLPTWIPTPQNIRFNKAIARLDALVLSIIDARRREQGANDLVAMLVSAKDDDTREQMTDRQLRDEVMTLILAGHETTANLLTWTLVLLSRHPDVERRLAEEVGAVIGDRAPTLEDLPKLRLTTRIIQESMRLYPPAWAFERQAISDDVLAGFAVPAGSIVGISPYTVHRHPAHWENPEGFDPERFSSDTRHKFSYIPFGGGPRQCIGNGFAMMEAQIILAMIAQRYRLELVAGHQVDLDPVVTLRPKNAVLVTLRAAGKAPKPVTAAKAGSSSPRLSPLASRSAT